jgi:predicted helicase
MNDSPDIATQKFWLMVRMGKELMDLHLKYEDALEYPLDWIWMPGVPRSWYVQKMRLTTDKTAVVVNESLTLADIPPVCFEYQLGNRSALEWIIDQYQVSTDPRTGIVSDPNKSDDPKYIVRLVCQVVSISVETVWRQKQMCRITGPQDWVGDAFAGENREENHPRDYWQRQDKEERYERIRATD